MGVRKNLTKRKKDKDKSGSKCEECEGWIGVYIRERDGTKRQLLLLQGLKVLDKLMNEIYHLHRSVNAL